MTSCPARIAMRLDSSILTHTCCCTQGLPVEEVWKTGNMRLTHSTALCRNMWSAVSSKAPMRPPTTRMLVSNRLMRRLELHFKLVLTHSLALRFTLQECHSCWQKRIMVRLCLPNLAFLHTEYTMLVLTKFCHTETRSLWHNSACGNQLSSKLNHSQHTCQASSSTASTDVLLSRSA